MIPRIPKVVFLVVGLAGLFAWWALTPTIQSNENKAFHAMNYLVGAQGRYSSTIGDPTGRRFWTKDVSGLRRFSPDFPLGIAEADTTPTNEYASSAKPYHGYFFRALDPATKPPEDKNDLPFEGCAICAYPAVYGKTGVKTYFINGLGIFSKDTEGRCLEKAPGLYKIRREWTIID